MADQVDATFQAHRQFAADASHELRSPLTVLGGYVDVLARTDLDSATRARTLAAMRREIDRLTRLSSDLLLLTQLEAGGGRLAARRVDLGDLVEDIGAAARIMGPDQHIEVVRNGPVPVVADPDRLTQALMNLVDNAVRHTPPGGEVRLSVERRDSLAVAEVRNDGAAIAPADLDHVFDRFYRVTDGAASQNGHHAGLGLAIVKAIAEASGGRAAASSDAPAPSRSCFRRPTKVRAAVGEPFVIAPVAPRERGPEPVAPDDLVPLALLGRVRGIDDRAEVDAGFDRLAEAHRVHRPVEHALGRGHDLGRVRAMRSASASTSAASPSAGTTRFTSPIRSASAASTRSPVNSSSRVFFWPTRYGIRARPVPSRSGSPARRAWSFGRDDQVARHRELEAAGERVAVDLGDDRLRAVEEFERRGHVGGEEVAPRHRTADVPARLLLEVVPGAEGAACSGERDDADAGSAAASSTPSRGHGPAPPRAR